MSGNRANAAAIQRRTMSAQSNIPPPGSSRPMQNQQQMRQTSRPAQQQMQPQYTQNQQYNRQHQQHQQQPKQNPKMSVSDAIGLLSLRMGRMETFVQQLPPLDQLALGSSGGNVFRAEGEMNENMRIVDEAVFTSIVTRLEKLEQTINEIRSSLSNTQNVQNYDEQSFDAMENITPTGKKNETK